MAKGKKRAKTYEQLESENDLLRRGNSAAAWASTISTICKYGFYSFAIYCSYKSIDALAGKTTITMFLANFVGALSADRYIAYILAVAGLIWGGAERRLRKRSIKHLHPRQKELEKLLDQKRSSSTLTLEGDTNPRDKERV